MNMRNPRNFLEDLERRLDYDRKHQSIVQILDLNCFNRFLIY